MCENERIAASHHIEGRLGQNNARFSLVKKALLGQRRTARASINMVNKIHFSL